MFPYIIVIILTTILTYFAQKTINKSKILFVFISILIIIIPSLLAGFRNKTNGIDILVYEKYLFSDAQQATSFIDYYISEDSDLLFLAINYIASCLSDKFGMALFLIEFCCMLFTYLAIVKMRKYAPMWLSILIYLLCYYNLSFNLMRQMVATSFLLYAFTFLLKDNNIKKFIILSIISFFFHKTAFLASLFFIYIFWALNSTQNRKTKTIVYVLGCFSILILFQILLSMLANLGGRFESYVAYGGMAGGNDWKPTIITIFVLGDMILLVLSYFLHYKENKLQRENYILFMIVITDLMSQFLGKYTGFASRMSCYFCIPYIFLLPHIFQKSNIINKQTKYIFICLLAISFMIIWVRMVNDTGNTIPYKSDILGI